MSARTIAEIVGPAPGLDLGSGSEIEHRDAQGTRGRNGFGRKERRQCGEKEGEGFHERCLLGGEILSTTIGFSQPTPERDLRSLLLLPVRTSVDQMEPRRKFGCSAEGACLTVRPNKGLLGQILVVFEGAGHQGCSRPAQTFQAFP